MSRKVVDQTAYPSAVAPASPGDAQPRGSFAAAKIFGEFTAWSEALANAVDVPERDTESMQRRLLACCNHSSYADSCAWLELNNILRHDSEELRASIRTFVRAHKRGSGSAGQRLPTAGAPRVLGDVFLACLGALILDGHRGKAEALMDYHMEHCQFHDDQRFGASFEDIERMELTPEGATVDGVLSVALLAMERVGSAIRGEPPGDHVECIEFMQNRDVRVVDIDGTCFGGVSPRAALVHQGQAPEEPGTDNDEAPERVADPAPGQKEVYCEVCEMWLNSRTQYNDHKIGGDHRKKCRKKDATEKGQVANTAQKRPPPPPPMPPPPRGVAEARQTPPEAVAPVADQNYWAVEQESGYGQYWLAGNIGYIPSYTVPYYTACQYWDLYGAAGGVGAWLSGLSGPW